MAHGLGILPLERNFGKDRARFVIPMRRKPLRNSPLLAALQLPATTDCFCSLREASE